VGGVVEGGGGGGGGGRFLQIFNRHTCHQWFVTLSPHLEHVFVFETFPKAYQFQVLQQHPGIIFELKSF